MRYEVTLRFTVNLFKAIRLGLFRAVERLSTRKQIMTGKALKERKIRKQSALTLLFTGHLFLKITIEPHRQIRGGIRQVEQACLQGISIINAPRRLFSSTSVYKIS